MSTLVTSRRCRANWVNGSTRTIDLTIGHVAILLAPSRPLPGKAPVLEETVRFIRDRLAQVTSASRPRAQTL